jgi:hypothetical protein
LPSFRTYNCINEAISVAIAGLGWWLRKRAAKRKSGNPEKDIYPMW